MAAHGVTASDIRVTLNNTLTAAGNTNGKYISIAITAQTDLQDQQGFKI
jgi:multidrug efflux pump subunit AcrB